MTAVITRPAGRGRGALCINFALTDTTPVQIRLIDIALLFTKTGGIQNLIPAIGDPLEIPFEETDGTINNIPVVSCT